jgi:hypothetical protein
MKFSSIKDESGRKVLINFDLVPYVKKAINYSSENEHYSIDLGIAYINFKTENFRDKVFEQILAHFEDFMFTA